MKTRPITAAEIDASKSAKGGFTAKQLRLWGVSWPPQAGWRKRILKNGVPAGCPFPDGFKPTGEDFAPPMNPLLAFSPKPAPVEMPADAIEIFTDGSCDPNPGPGGWGFAVYRGTDEIHEASGGDLETTNNRMELTAIIEALRWLDPCRPAILWTDSQYCQRGCETWRHGWKRKSWTRGKNRLANADLWQTLDELLEAHVVDVRWTRGHVGTLGNERADELAEIGRRGVMEADLVPSGGHQLDAPPGWL